MKKLIILSIITCAFTTPNALSMAPFATAAKMGFSGLCSAIELAITSTPLVVSGILYPRDLLKAQQQDSTESNAPQVIIDHIAQLAKERNIQYEIKVIIGKDTPYAMHTYKHVMQMSSEEAEELESLLNNTNHNELETKLFNFHNATIHHELTHDIKEDQKRIPLYEAIIATFGSIGASSTLTGVVKKYIPEVKKNFTVHNGFKLARSGLTYAVAFNIVQMNMGSKYTELRADDGIPSKKEYLEAMAEYYENKHTDGLKYIDSVKENLGYQAILYSPLRENEQFNRKQLFAMKTLPREWFNKPLIMNTILYMDSTHPSNLHRAMRLRKRIANIEQQEAAQQQNQPIDPEIPQ